MFFSRAGSIGTLRKNTMVPFKRAGSIQWHPSNHFPLTNFHPCTLPSQDQPQQLLASSSPFPGTSTNQSQNKIKQHLPNIFRLLPRTTWPLGKDRIHPILCTVRAAPDAIPQDRKSCTTGGVEKKVNQPRAFRLSEVEDVVGALEGLTEAKAVNGLKFPRRVNSQCLWGGLAGGELEGEDGCCRYEGDEEAHFRSGGLGYRNHSGKIGGNYAMVNGI
jgi:hypothetical protein